MGKLQTAVNLPKRILLQGWANDEGGLNINGEYTYTINFDISIIQGGFSAFYNGYKHNTLNSFIYFLGGWQFLTTADPNQWDNPSANNVLPLTGWIENNAQGPAGSITILENISGKNTKISIKKQNLSILKSSAFYPESESSYIFKSPVNNILANIFNYLQFVDYSEAVTIYYEGSFSGQSIDFYSDGSGWTDLNTFENRNNYIIPTNSLIIITLNSDKNITVGGGSIIQNYSSGKINILC